MKRSIIALSILAIAVAIALPAGAVENSTWGQIKAAAALSPAAKSANAAFRFEDVGPFFGVDADGNLSFELGALGTATLVVTQKKVTQSGQGEVTNLSGKAAVFNFANTGFTIFTVLPNGEEVESEDWQVTISASGNASLRANYTR